MSNDTDILVLDGKIRENFQAQKDSLSTFHERLSIMLSTLDDPQVSDRIKDELRVAAEKLQEYIRGL